MKRHVKAMIGIALAILSVYVGVTFAASGGMFFAGILLGAALRCAFELYTSRSRQDVRT